VLSWIVAEPSWRSNLFAPFAVQCPPEGNIFLSTVKSESSRNGYETCHASLVRRNCPPRGLPATGLQLVAASRTYARLRQLRGKVRFARTLAELKADR